MTEPVKSPFIYASGIYHISPRTATHFGGRCAGSISIHRPWDFYCTAIAKVSQGPFSFIVRDTHLDPHSPNQQWSNVGLHSDLLGPVFKPFTLPTHRYIPACSTITFEITSHSDKENVVQLIFIGYKVPVQHNAYISPFTGQKA